MTTYEYDDDGRLVRAVTVHEPRFTGDDTLAALERSEEHALACPGCGLPRDESFPTDPEHAKQLDRELVAEAVTCTGCGKREAFIKRLDNPEPGMKVIVRRRDEEGA